MSSRGFAFYLIRTKRATSLASVLCTCNYVHVSWWSLESTWIRDRLFYVSELRIQFSKSWTSREMLFVHFLFKIAFLEMRGTNYEEQSVLYEKYRSSHCKNPVNLILHLEGITKANSTFGLLYPNHLQNFCLGTLYLRSIRERHNESDKFKIQVF